MDVYFAPDFFLKTIKTNVFHTNSAIIHLFLLT